jgi:hypothetical protein
MGVSGVGCQCGAQGAQRGFGSVQGVAGRGRGSVRGPRRSRRTATGSGEVGEAGGRPLGGGSSLASRGEGRIEVVADGAGSLGAAIG